MCKLNYMGLMKKLRLRHILTYMYEQQQNNNKKTEEKMTLSIDTLNLRDY